MNRGTALKWIEAIESGKYEQAAGGLRLDEKCFCIFGVLLDFLDPTAWKMNALGIYEWNGLSVMLSPDHPTTKDVMKRCKLKSVNGKFENENGHKSSIVEINDQSLSWQWPLHFLKHYYEQI